MSNAKSQDFIEKLEELRLLLQSDHIPPRVKSACLCLSKDQKKLFAWVPEIDGTSGTPALLPGLHASDFLCELLKALRALDWPQVIVLVHDAFPDADSSGMVP